MKIGVIGCGNMGQALIRGILRAKVAGPGSIFIWDASAGKRRSLSKGLQVKVARSNAGVVSRSQVILLCVKPQQMGQVLSEIRPRAFRGKLFISVAAGITTGWIEKKLGKVRVVRVMPNTPALVGEGMSAMALGAAAGRSDLKVAVRIFGCVGKVVEVPQRWMDAVTAVSGSGPAYFFALMEEMIKAGVALGLPAAVAKKLVVQTAVGAAKLAAATGHDPALLRQRVTSKGGTTEAAFKVFSRKGLGRMIESGIKAAAKRSRKLSS